jgi:dipeptide/tripeptide permease
MQDTGFFGHPRGLSMTSSSLGVERFSYYACAPFSSLYMVAPVASGGSALFRCRCRINGGHGSAWGRGDCRRPIADRWLGQYAAHSSAASSSPLTCDAGLSAVVLLRGLALIVIGTGR